MTTPALAGRILHLKLDVIVRPRDRHAATGETDGAMAIGERLALETGLAAQRLGGDDCEVVVAREIVVY